MRKGEWEKRGSGGKERAGGPAADRTVIVQTNTPSSIDVVPLWTRNTFCQELNVWHISACLSVCRPSLSHTSTRVQGTRAHRSRKVKHDVSTIPEISNVLARPKTQYA